MGVHSIPGPAQDRMTKSEVVQYLGISEPALEKLIRERKFPKGVKPTPQSSPIWLGAVVAAYMMLRHAMGGDDEKEEKEEKS